MKQSDISAATKVAVLDAAAKVIVERGAEALTLEAVARQAGISKGGLLYHFPSKRRLIQGMIGRMIAGVDEAVATEMAANGGDFLGAYIRVSFADNGEHNRISTALFAAIANQPELLQPLQLRYRAWQDQAAAAAPSPEMGTLIRLALDGLWLAELLEFAPPAPETKEELMRALLAMARKHD